MAGLDGQKRLVYMSQCTPHPKLRLLTGSQLVAGFICWLALGCTTITPREGFSWKKTLVADQTYSDGFAAFTIVAALPLLAVFSWPL